MRIDIDNSYKGQISDTTSLILHIFNVRLHVFVILFTP